jgi:hypothetical protein
MRIKRFRLSYVWTAASAELIRDAAAGPLGDLPGSFNYVKIFNNLLGGGIHPLVDLPWPRRTGAILPETNNYWSDAIVSSFLYQPNANWGKLAWKASVQFRHKGDLFSVGHADRCFGEGWYFPSGVGVSLTAWISGDFDGDQFKQTVSDFTGGTRTVTVGGKTSSDIIDSAARKAMDILLAQGFGLPPLALSNKPIRILTVTTAEHDPNETNKPAAEAAMLEDVLIAGGGIPTVPITPAKNIYALPHARVIWRPDKFLSKQKSLHTLGCLHRNVTMATLHAASVIKAAEATMAVIDSGATVSARVGTYADALAGLLGRMNNPKDPNIYKQQCLRDQIAEAGTIVDRLRKSRGMSLLQ